MLLVQAASLVFQRENGFLKSITCVARPVTNEDTEQVTLSSATGFKTAFLWQVAEITCANISFCEKGLKSLRLPCGHNIEHRITEGLGSEGTFKYHLVHTPCHGQGSLFVSHLCIQNSESV